MPAVRFHDPAESHSLRLLHLAALTAKRLLLTVLLFVPLATARGAGENDLRAEKLHAWILANTHKRSGLPESHVGDERLRNWTFSYDAAVTAISHLAMGHVKDARRIIDFYIRTPQAFRLGGVIEAVNPASSALGEDYAVRTGSNLWLGIASYHLFRATREEKYLRFAKLQADFGLAMQMTDPEHFNDGAVRLGPIGSDANAGDQHIQNDDRMPRFFDIISTEHNLDAYALFGMIAREAPPHVKKYAEAQFRVATWLRRIGYNAGEKRFNRGAYRSVDRLVATDVQAWAVSALGPKVLAAFDPGAVDGILDFIQKRCMVTVDFQRVDGAIVKVTGADFVDQGGANAAGRGRMVSPEWTFEVANAYRRTGDVKRAQEIIDGVFPAAVEADGGLAFPYATLGDAPVGHDWNTPSADTLSVIGAAWGILALKGVDPLVVPE